MLRTYKSRVVRRTFWLIKMVPTWKKFEKRWPKWTQCHTPEDQKPHLHHRKSLRTHKLLFLSGCVKTAYIQENMGRGKMTHKVWKMCAPWQANHKTLQTHIQKFGLKISVIAFTQPLFIYVHTTLEIPAVTGATDVITIMSSSKLATLPNTSVNGTLKVTSQEKFHGVKRNWSWRTNGWVSPPSPTHKEHFMWCIRSNDAVLRQPSFLDENCVCCQDWWVSNLETVDAN